MKNKDNATLEKSKDQLLREKLTKAYWTCDDCGKKYGESWTSVSTYHIGKCDVCNKRKQITEARDFNYFRSYLE